MKNCAQFVLKTALQINKKLCCKSAKFAQNLCWF